LRASRSRAAHLLQARKADASATPARSLSSRCVMPSPFHSTRNRSSARSGSRASQVEPAARARFRGTRFSRRAPCARRKARHASASVAPHPCPLPARAEGAPEGRVRGACWAREPASTFS
jgi:hypothetical protein